MLEIERRASQSLQEVGKRFVPGVWVVKVTRVSRSLHYHHPVIRQIAQVSERHLSELSVLVAVNDQRRDLNTHRVNFLDLKNPYFLHVLA